MARIRALTGCSRRHGASIAVVGSGRRTALIRQRPLVQVQPRPLRSAGPWPAALRCAGMAGLRRRSPACRELPQAQVRSTSTARNGTARSGEAPGPLRCAGMAGLRRRSSGACARVKSKEIRGCGTRSLGRGGYNDLAVAAPRALLVGAGRPMREAPLGRGRLLLAVTLFVVGCRPNTSWSSASVGTTSASLPARPRVMLCWTSRAPSLRSRAAAAIFPGEGRGGPREPRLRSRSCL